MTTATPISFRTSLNRAVQGFVRGNWYPILLPHVDRPGCPPREIPEKVRAALPLCDGRHTLAEVARQAGVARSGIIAQHDAEVLLLWPKPLPALPILIPADEVTDIILSPHLDDAFLSLGAEMLRIRDARRGHRPAGCVVLDVFSKVSWWRFDVSPEILPHVQATRDAEEELVTRLAGAILRRVDLYEAPLRGYPLKTIFTAGVRPEDYAEVREPIRAAVAGLRAEFPRAKWHLPLCVGNHVDHRIARDAALEVLDNESNATPFSFYEDLPYAALPGGVADFAHFVPGRELRRVPLRGDGIGLSLKQRLLRVYWSQLAGKQIDAVGAYARRVYAAGPVERSWVDTTPLF